MSTNDQEARALDDVHDFMLGICSNRKIGRVSELRAEARRIMKHYPLGAGDRWLMAFEKEEPWRRLGSNQPVTK